MDVSARNLHVQVVFSRGMAVILCNYNFCAAFLSGICCSPSSAVYYFLLRTVLCLQFCSSLSRPLTTGRS